MKGWGWNAIKISILSLPNVFFFTILRYSASVLLVLCYLWSRRSEPRRLLQTQRHWTGQRGSMWLSSASRHCPAVPNCRMHTLHLGGWPLGRSKYRHILSFLSYLQPPTQFPCFRSPSVRQMNRCLTISLRFLLAEISAFSFFLRTIKRTTCRYSCVNRGGLVDNHQTVNLVKPQSTDGHHPFCPAEYHWSVSR